MKTLSIFDVDDTIIMVDIKIGVKDDDGNVVEWIPASEYYVRAEAGELTADGCCFSQYDCAQTFYDTGTFNPVVCEVLDRQIMDPDVDVWLITGRSSPSCLDTYMRRFHEAGFDLRPDQVIFAAEGAFGEARTHTRIMKKPHYERLITLEYDRVVGFEDNPDNLKVLHEVCVDNDVPFEGHLVLKDGTTKRFTLNDVLEKRNQALSRSDD